MSKRIPPRLNRDDGRHADAARWQLGEFVLDETRRELRQDETVIAIEPKPLHLLMLLVRHPGELITKDELVDRLWGGRAVTDTVIARCVAKLRTALGKRQDWVRTIHGYGYRYDGWVEPLVLPPVPSPASEAAACSSLPGRSGWRLLRRLGDGGDTWLAEDADGAQRVFKLAHNAARLTALKREAAVHRLLSAQTESNELRTVPLLDWNFHARPYFLEFGHCPSGNLAEWLQRQPAPLSRPDRLELVAGLAMQLSALHALGVLHKDFKPGNVLVLAEPPGALPQLALADFGSGGVINPDRLRKLGLTRMGLSLSALDADSGSGTPLYLAPEVIAGRPWTRQADLYALGVLLYQLLVNDLRRPLAPGWERDIDDLLLREDIAATCDQSPEHRLLDAQELAQRLQGLEQRRHQRQMAEQAETELAQQRRSLARARARRGWQWALVGVLALGLAASTTLLLATLHAQRQAESASATAQAVSRFLDESVLGAADPYRAGGGRNVTIASVLDKAVRDLGALHQQPVLQLRLGRTLASAYHNLGLEPRSREIGLAALAAASEGGIAADDAELNRLRNQLAWIELNLARYPESRALFEQILRHSDSPDASYQARYGLARLRFEEGYHAESATAYRTLLAESTQQGLDEWFVSDLRWDLAESEFETHDWQSAGAHLDAVQALYGRQFAPGNVRQLWLNISIGYRLMMLEDYAAAESLLRGTQTLASHHLGSEHPVAMTALHHLSAIRNKQGRPAEALPMIDTVLAWRTRHYGEAHYITRMTMARRGEALILLGRPAEAESLLQRAWQASVDTVGADHPHTLELQRLLAESLLAQGRMDSAEQAFRSVLALGPQRMARHSNRLAWTRYGLARTLRANGQREESDRLLTQAAADFRRNYGGRHSLQAVIEKLLASRQTDTRPPMLS